MSVSAKGALSLLAWGNAPGIEKPQNTSAESAIHTRSWRELLVECWASSHCFWDN